MAHLFRATEVEETKWCNPPAQAVVCLLSPQREEVLAASWLTVHWGWARGSSKEIKESNTAPSWDIAKGSPQLTAICQVGCLEITGYWELRRERDLRALGGWQRYWKGRSMEIMHPLNQMATGQPCTVGFLFSFTLPRLKRLEILNLLNILHRKCHCHYRLSLWKGIKY